MSDTPENVECQTCGGTGRRQVDQYGNVWGDRLAEAMSPIIVGDIPCPDCTPENVETCSTCVRCGRLPSINGNDETVMVVEGGFRHAICDDRWDTPENVEEP